MVDFFPPLFQFHTSRSRVDVEVLHNHRFSLFFSSPHFFFFTGEQKKRERKRNGGGSNETRWIKRKNALKACIINARFHRETSSTLPWCTRVSTRRRLRGSALPIHPRVNPVIELSIEEQCENESTGLIKLEIEIRGKKLEGRSHLDN